MSDKPAADAAPKKKGRLLKMLMLAVGALVLIGGGVAGGLYVARGGKAAAAEAPGPKLVPKSEQKKGAPEGGESTEAAKSSGGTKTPAGEGGEKFASNYYALDKDFTSNLKDSVHFVQVGVAVSTPYDDTVIEHLKTNEIAVRSAILMALGDATEDQVFTSQGKRQLQVHLAAAINQVLKEKEGFGGVGNVYFTSFVVQ